MFGVFDFSQVSDMPITEKENLFKEHKKLSKESKFLLILLELMCKRLKSLFELLIAWNEGLLLWLLWLSVGSKAVTNSWEV